MDRWKESHAEAQTRGVAATGLPMPSADGVRTNFGGPLLPAVNCVLLPAMVGKVVL